MRILVALVIALLASCTDGRVDALQADVLPRLQKRIGDLETRPQPAPEPPPAWWCSADRCARERFNGAAAVTWAWCPRATEGDCKPTVAACGAGCVGVR